MSLLARERKVHTGTQTETELVVACPQRIDPVPIRECARCELCDGVELDGVVSVRCAVAPRDEPSGAPGPEAAISTIMTSPVVTVPEDAAIENVQWLLLARGISAVPVLDRLARPIGIVAKTDLLRDRDGPTRTVALHAALRSQEPEHGWSEHEISGARAADVMTPVVRSVLEGMSIAATSALMAREHIHHAIVLDASGRLVGIVSTLDIVRWVAARERFAPRST